MPAQLRLSLRRAPDYARAAFIRSDSNAAALEALEAWPSWRGGALVLVGPCGSGKTHLATVWARRAGAAMLAPDLDVAALSGLQGPIVLEDADRGAAGEALFHLINRAALPDSALLITARTPPTAWESELPDLRSRLKALPVALLSEPDDAVLRELLQKLFEERNIRPPPDLLSYLARRIERSAAAALAVVERLDEAADAQARPVSRALAREMLGRQEEGGALEEGDDLEDADPVGDDRS